MSARFDHVVVGGGPMGASTARYLAEGGRKTLLLAPRDPAVSTSGIALHSGHGDHTRITRRLDTHATWARLASASIARYRELERHSGIRFFEETGCLTIVEGDGARAEARLAATTAIAERFDVRHERVVGADILRQFPALRVAAGSTVLAESRNAGWIDPRAAVRAQIVVGERRGLVVAEDVMTSARIGEEGVEIETALGRIVEGDEAVFAMGPYAAFDLPVPAPPLTVYARTVVHVRLDDDRRHALDGLQSLSVRGLTDDENCYILPPARYPDGHWYIKIGGGPRAKRIDSRQELDEWYAGSGDPVLGAHLRARLEQLVPVTQGAPSTTKPCAILVTESALPLITRIQPRATLVTGCNGHAAKSGDEIGSSAAELILRSRQPA